MRMTFVASNAAHFETSWDCKGRVIRFLEHTNIGF